MTWDIVIAIWTAAALMAGLFRYMHETIGEIPIFKTAAFVFLILIIIMALSTSLRAFF